MKGLMTRREAQELFKVSYPTILNWEKAGILKPIKISSRVYYQVDDIKRLIESKKSDKAVIEVEINDDE